MSDKKTEWSGGAVLGGFSTRSERTQRTEKKTDVLKTKKPPNKSQTSPAMRELLF